MEFEVLDTFKNLWIEHDRAKVLGKGEGSYPALGEEMDGAVVGPVMTSP